MSRQFDVVRPPRISSGRGFKLLLVGGFLACGFATVVAHESPASGFELSIYRSTPAAFWVGLGASLLVGLVTSVFVDDRLRSYAVLLSGTAFAAVVSVPILRGYYFYGEYDSLTHIGYIRDVDTGVLSPFDLFYPAVHELTLLVQAVTGFPIPKSLLFVVFLFPLVFVAFLALTVYVLVETTGGFVFDVDRFAAVIGLFSGMLLLPINQIATHYMAPHSFSETVLYSPLTVLLLLMFAKSRPTGSSDRLGIGLLFALSSVTMVLLHPLQAAVFVVVLCVAAFVQFVHRWYDPQHPLARNERMYVLAAFHTVVFGLWTAGKPKFTDTYGHIVTEMRGALLGGGGSTGAVVQERSTALTAVGSGLEDIFLRLFLVSLVFSALGGLVSLASVAGRLDDRSPEVKYLAASLILLVPLSFGLFVGNISKYFFRIHGSIMVFVTIFGAFAIFLLFERARKVMSTSRVRLALTILFCLLLIHSMAILYTSPFIYKFNRQVSEANYEGYETAFSYQGDGIMYAGIRQGPNRYMHAIYGTESVPPSKDVDYHGYARTAVVPGANLTDLDGYFDEDHYVIVTTRDVDRELGGYRGLRYNASQFDSVAAQPGVHRVQSNGAFRLYLHDERYSVGERG